MLCPSMLVVKQLLWPSCVGLVMVGWLICFSRQYGELLYLGAPFSLTCGSTRENTFFTHSCTISLYCQVHIWLVNKRLCKYFPGDLLITCVLSLIRFVYSVTVLLPLCLQLLAVHCLRHHLGLCWTNAPHHSSESQLLTTPPPPPPPILRHTYISLIMPSTSSAHT